jgi:accessory colonization factor AcfC
MARHPEAIEPGSIRQIGSRQVGIIVRKGNPKRIADLAGLGREAVKLLDVKLETTGTKKKNLARAFILFLQSEAGQTIFQKRGWE